MSNRWLCDVRVGLVAVYQGEQRNCLSGISDAVYTRIGQCVGGSWDVAAKEIAKAQRIADVLNRLQEERDALLEAAEFAIGRVFNVGTEGVTDYDWATAVGRLVDAIVKARTS